MEQARFETGHSALPVSLAGRRRPARHRRWLIRGILVGRVDARAGGGDRAPAPTSPPSAEQARPGAGHRREG